jgi:hypothetical protein
MRAKQMQVLTNNVQARHPGVTIYGIGDKAHQQESSDHNEDDTAGVRTPQTDADSTKEHRAIDIMLGNAFSRADGNQLVVDLTQNEANKTRLSLVIFDGFEYSKRTGFKKVARTSDKHPDHVHVSGDAEDDDNEAGWILGGAPGVPSVDEALDVDGDLGPKTVRKWQKVMGTTVDGRIDDDNSQLMRKVQEKLKATVDHTLVVDGDWGKRTTRALQQYLGSPVTGAFSSSNSSLIKALQRRLNENRF